MEIFFIYLSPVLSLSIIPARLGFQTPFCQFGLGWSYERKRMGFSGLNQQLISVIKEM